MLFKGPKNFGVYTIRYCKKISKGWSQNLNDNIKQITMLAMKLSSRLYVVFNNINSIVVHLYLASTRFFISAVVHTLVTGYCIT